MSFDIRTLAIVATISSVLAALSMIVLWRTNRKKPSTIWWAGGSSLIATGFLLISFRNAANPFLSILAANLFIAGGYAAIMLGIDHYLRRKPRYVLAVLSLVLVALLFLRYTYITSDVSARIMVISGALALYAYLSAWPLMGAIIRRFSVAEAIAVGLFVTHGSFMVFRTAYAGLSERIADFMSAGIVHALAFMDVIFISFALALCFAIMTTMRLNQYLASEIEIKDRFFSIIAHDLRAPFNALLGFSEVIKDKAERGSLTEVATISGMMNSSCRDVLSLLDNLLVWAHSQMAGQTSELSTIELRREVDAAFDLLGQAAADKSVELRNEVAEQPVSAHAEILRMVLRNLVANALKFSHPGGAIRVLAHRDQDRVILSVTDTGIGIPAEILPTLFEAAKVTSRTGTDGEAGTGLGLALCKDLCASVGGDIWIDSTVGEGTTVSFMAGRGLIAA